MTEKGRRRKETKKQIERTFKKEVDKKGRRASQKTTGSRRRGMKMIRRN